MRYCHNCGKITTGEPLYCQFCGRTYGVRLCPRLHPNGRNATVCCQCGSRELSMPAPRIPFWLRPLLFLLTLVPGFVLLVLSVLFFIAFLRQLLTNPNTLFQMMLLGLVLALAWYVWMQLPGFVRRALSRSSKGGKTDRFKH
jgi:hypothetical protein